MNNLNELLYKDIKENCFLVVEDHTNVSSLCSIRIILMDINFFSIFKLATQLVIINRL